MPYEDEKVRRIVREGTNPRSRPTWQQIDAISCLTYDSGAFKTIKRMLFRRLDPKAYILPEAEHTMLMLQSCLTIASHEFVAYVHHDLTPLIAQFHAKGDSGDYRGLHRAATQLLRVLRDGANSHAKEKDLNEDQRHEERKNDNNRDNMSSRERILHAQGHTDNEHRDKPHGSRSAPKETPLTPPRTPSSRSNTEGSIEAVTPQIPSPTGLLTPMGSPVARNIRLMSESRPTSVMSTRDAHAAHVDERIRSMTANTPPAITTAQMEEAAGMTYDPAELEVIRNVIDARLDALKSQQTHHHLIKTLTLIHHCLYCASDDFVELCRQRRNVIENLLTFSCPNPDVRRLAGTALDRLKDENGLQKERQNRKAFRKPRHVSSQLRRLSNPLQSSNSSSEPVARRQSLLEKVDTVPIVEKIGNYAIGRGGYSDVWKGRLTLDEGVTFTLVAVKVLRLTSRATDPERLRKRLEREVRVWRELDHDSIAEFYGVVYDSNYSPALISPWYDRGSADIYIQSQPDAEPMKLLWEILLGVEYLHENNVVHGDIKGGNVMVDEQGHAKLIDFGLSRLIDSVAGPGLTTSTVSFSIRWCAPELVQSDDSPTTKASDVYAFASTSLELLTGKVPYHSLGERAVILALAKGVTPTRPKNNPRCPEKFWSLLDQCWKVTSLRPTISQVKTQMHALYRAQ